MLATVRFLVAVPFLGCGANAAAGGAVGAERALPCPVASSASVLGVLSVPPKAKPPAEGLGPKREQVVVEAFDCFSTVEEPPRPELS
jgi:hypothetical protein